MSATETMTAIAADAAATEALGAALASRCNASDCVLLQGDLGAGKTTFARGFIRALCKDAGEIVSPTFTLVQSYDADNGGSVWHFDLYRLKSSEELMEIGIDDALRDGITLIEWPEIAQGMLPAQALSVAIGMGKNSDERVLTFSGGGAWRGRLDFV